MQRDLKTITILMLALAVVFMACGKGGVGEIAGNAAVGIAGEIKSVIVGHAHLQIAEIDPGLAEPPHGHQADFFRARDQATLLGTKPVTRQLEVLALPDQPLRLVQVTKRPLRDAAQQIYGLLGIAQDKTAESQDSDSFEALLAESDQLCAEKQAWVRHLSHSLRTPLLSVMGMQSLLASALANTPHAPSLSTLHG